MATASQSIRERVVNVGIDGNIVAIATESDASKSILDQTVASKPTAIVLNAGVLHRVGPHRLNVHLARRLAVLGFDALRMDLSGIGDSRPLPDAVSFRESSVSDIRTAMNHLENETGATEFLICGLCSGADNAMATAIADTRVKGLVLIDPHAYGTPASGRRRLAERMRRAGRLEAIARGVPKLLARTFGRSAGHPTEDGTAESGRQPPPQAEFGGQISGLVDRGLRILFIFSGANGEKYNHEDQLFEAFPTLRGRVARAYFPTANHVFTDVGAQDALLSTITGWCRQHFV